MSTYLGRYTYTMDKKGRVSLPAAFRREGEGQRFVLIQVHEPSLTLYPEEAWRDVSTRLRNLLRDDPDARMWVRRVLSNAVEVAPDAQGRILIPSHLQEAGGLSGQVMMVGLIDKVEIWDPTDFEGAMAGEDEAHQRYASKIFR